MCFSSTLSVRPIISFPCSIHKPVLYICISVAARQIGSSVPFFRLSLSLYIYLQFKKYIAVFIHHLNIHFFRIHLFSALCKAPWNEVLKVQRWTAWLVMSVMSTSKTDTHLSSLVQSRPRLIWGYKEKEEGSAFEAKSQRDQ